MEMNLEKKVTEEWRLERKFPFYSHQYSQAKVAILTHPFLFISLYEPRWVHNIYFDSLDLKAYQENINGLSERSKSRIRWYQDSRNISTKPMLEIKSKKNQLGTKKMIQLTPEFLKVFNPLNLNSIELMKAIKKINALQMTNAPDSKTARRI